MDNWARGVSGAGRAVAFLAAACAPHFPGDAALWQAFAAAARRLRVTTEERQMIHGAVMEAGLGATLPST